jgi:glyoxylase-like metal-dependent hydrolase (beta-lactamase superfamily II)
MGATIERVVTSGTFSIDGGTWDVDNNVWLVGNDLEVIVIDPAHDATAVIDAIGDRTVLAIICTHGHDDHISEAGKVADLTGAPILLHPDDLMLWHVVHPDRDPSHLLDDDLLEVADIQIRVLHTPGHSLGGVCLWIPQLGAVISGDTLFKGGPGATGRSFSDFATILDSIRERLLKLPPATRVLPGHGEETTIGAEAADYAAWVARGH